MKVATITFPGLDRIYRTPQRRWSCAGCGAQGWTFDSTIAPADHDRPDGRVCRPAIAR